LTGGAGSGQFIRNCVAESKAGTAGDLVRDFEHGGDILDLSGIDAVRRTPVDDTFSFIGQDKFSDTAGELRIKIKKDGVTVLGDVNGDGRADFILIVRGEDSLEASDFLL
jgi:Ca2+-binding RTX toxin-like protein